MLGVKFLSVKITNPLVCSSPVDIFSCHVSPHETKFTTFYSTNLMVSLCVGPLKNVENVKFSLKPPVIHRFTLNAVVNVAAQCGVEV